MNADRLTLLRDSLERRQARIVGSDVNHFERLLIQFWQYLQNDSWLKGIVEDILRSDSEAETIASGTLASPQNNPPPRDDSKNLAVQCHLWRLLVQKPEQLHQRIGTLVHNYYYFLSTGERQLDNIKSQLVGRVVDALMEKLAEQSTLFGTLVRYRTRSEVYNRTRLQELYGDGKGEAEKRLKPDLHLYLHDQGVDFVIEPEMDADKLDLLASPFADKKVVEAKVFDDGNRDKRRVADGVHQTRSYARLHGVSRSYYVTYSMSQKHLVFEAPTALPHLYEIRFSDSLVYALVVNIATPDKSASKRRIDEVVITRADMGL